MPKPPSTDPNPASDAAEKHSPLDYMLQIMRDPAADPKRRDRMAIAAASFMHRKAIAAGVKAQRQADAQQVAKTARFSRSKAPKK